MSQVATRPPTNATRASPAGAKRFHHGSLKQSLLDAALAAPDIEGLSLNQLAAGAGVTPAAVYRHFAGREELLADVARIGFDRLEARFAQAIDIRRPPETAAAAALRLARLAKAYLGFADDEPALWRLMFGSKAAAYRARARPPERRHTYDYLTAALSGLHLAGVIPRSHDAQDALFAWSAIHGAATLRSGRVPFALGEVGALANDIATRVIRALQ
ncbi:MAG: TetR/AcrR family transcriptional regulator [Rubrivivax sp.]|jgi:AcrR family transcriptional regulator|nr:TetR/AcrR family transcriptional regulator [Rubrivivax sp.]